MTATDSEISNLKLQLAIAVEAFSKTSEDLFVSHVKNEITNIIEKLKLLTTFLNVNSLPEEDDCTDSEDSAIPSTLTVLSNEEVTSVNVDPIAYEKLQLVVENDVILKRLFEHLDLSTLKNVREVCRVWKDIATPVLGNKSRIRLRTVEEFRDLLTIPASLIKTIDIVFRCRNGMNIEESEEFLQLFAKHGSNLMTLYQVVSPSTLESEQEDRQYISLKSQDRCILRDPEWSNNLVFNRPLKLQKFDISFHPKTNSTDYFCQFKAYPCCESSILENTVEEAENHNNSNTFTKVRVMTIYNFVVNAFTQPLSDIAKLTPFFNKSLNEVFKHMYNLKYLNLSVHGTTLRDELPMLLDGVKNTLECLILSDEHMDNSWTYDTALRGQECQMLRYPVLSKLKVFDMTMRFGNDYGLDMKSLEFVGQKMPNLEQLKIVRSCYKSISFLFKHIRTPQLNLKKLNLGKRSCQCCDLSSVAAIKKFFPNVSTLSLGLEYKDADNTTNKSEWLKELSYHLADLKLEHLTIRHFIDEEAELVGPCKAVKCLKTLSITYDREITLDGFIKLTDLVKELTQLSKLCLVDVRGVDDTLPEHLFTRLSKRFGVELTGEDVSAKDTFDESVYF